MGKLENHFESFSKKAREKSKDRENITKMVRDTEDRRKALS